MRIDDLNISESSRSTVSTSKHFMLPQDCTSLSVIGRASSLCVNADQEDRPFGKKNCIQAIRMSQIKIVTARRIKPVSLNSALISMLHGKLVASSCSCSSDGRFDVNEDVFVDRRSLTNGRLSWL